MIKRQHLTTEDFTCAKRSRKKGNIYGEYDTWLTPSAVTEFENTIGRDILGDRDMVHIPVSITHPGKPFPRWAHPFSMCGYEIKEAVIYKDQIPEFKCACMLCRAKYGTPFLQGLETWRNFEEMYTHSITSHGIAFTLDCGLTARIPRPVRLGDSKDLPEIHAEDGSRFTRPRGELKWLSYGIPNFRHPLLNRFGGTFRGFETKYIGEINNRVFFACRCTECGTSDVMTARQMIEHQEAEHGERLMMPSSPLKPVIRKNGQQERQEEKEDA